MGDADASSYRNQRDTCIDPPVFKFTDETCIICLGNVKNRAFINSCSHAFCLRCLLKWTKEKLVCPLCNQLFSVVYFNVTSRDSYKKLPLRCLIEPPDFRCSGELGYNNSQFGRIKRLLEFGNVLSHDSDMLAINKKTTRRRMNPYCFRQSVYANNYWALAALDPQEWLEPDFYLDHPEFLVNLYPWLYRELEVLLSDKEHLIDEAFNLVVSMLHIYEIYSSKCVNNLKPLLGEQTQHFLHELIHFIASRMSMSVYDNEVVYSSVNFLRGNAIRGAVVNGPGEYKEFITLVDDKPVITEGLKRERVISLFPTITYADIEAITPDGHGGNRRYALHEIGNGFIDAGQIIVSPQPEPNSAFSL